MSHIQDKSFWYSALRKYVDATFFMAYRQFKYVGLDKIPTDGAILFAPNHANALMDALAVLVVDKQPTVFVARADIFKKPIVARILRFLKIMPILRIRDGFKNLKQNDAIMEQAVDVLLDKVPFCIMPEGTHRAQHSLLPLVKGIFRIALLTNERAAGKMPVYIVPLGIEYGNYYRYRSSLLVSVGDPINVTTFVQEHSTLAVPDMINALRDELTDRLKQVMLYIPDNEMYEAIYELCLISTPGRLRTLSIKNDVETRLQVNKSVVADMLALKEVDELKANDLLTQLTEFARLRRSQKISANSLSVNNFGLSLCGQLLFLIVTFPYFLLAAVVTLPIWSVSEHIVSRLDDPVFKNSFRYVLTLLITPVIWVIAIVVCFTLFSWPWALVFFLLILPAHLFLHDYLRVLRLCLSDYRLARNKQLRTLLTQIKLLFH